MQVLACLDALSPYPACIDQHIWAWHCCPPCASVCSTGSCTCRSDIASGWLSCSANLALWEELALQDGTRAFLLTAQLEGGWQDACRM